MEFKYNDATISKFVENYKFIKEQLCFLETLGRVKVIETKMLHLKSTPRWIASVIYDDVRTEFVVTSKGIRLVRH